MKNHIKKIVLAILIVIISLIALREAYVGIYFLKDTGDVFGAEKAELFLPSSPASYFKAQDILDIANKAFSDINSNDGEYGKLERYSINNEGVTSEDHSIKLISAHFGENSGYMWVVYYQTGFDSNGQQIYGNGSNSLFGKNVSRWELAKVNEQWVVSEIKEQP